MNKISKTNIIEFSKYFLLSVILIYVLIYNINLLIERNNNLKGHTVKVIGSISDTNCREDIILPFNIIGRKSTTTVNVKYTYNDITYVVEATKFNELNIPKTIKYIFRERCVVYIDPANPNDGQTSVENGRIIPTLMIILIVLIIIIIVGIIDMILYLGSDESDNNSSEAISNNIIV